MVVFGRKQPPTGTRHPKELPVPGAAFETDSTEVFRAWIVGQGLQVSFQMGFKDPAVWGILLVDIARHAARIYEAEGVMSEEDALAAIRSMSDAEWNNMTDPGTTGQARQ
jgi:hypothetical protein